jgi:hypothetical protein
MQLNRFEQLLESLIQANHKYVDELTLYFPDREHDVAFVLSGLTEENIIYFDMYDEQHRNKKLELNIPSHLFKNFISKYASEKHSLLDKKEPTKELINQYTELLIDSISKSDYPSYIEKMTIFVEKEKLEGMISLPLHYEKNKTFKL